MAAKSFLRLVSGTLQRVFGTQVSAGGANAGDIVALDDTGRLDPSLLPVGVGADVTIAVASEALAAGDLVNIYDNAGVANARKADASNYDKRAVGFVLAGVVMGANASVYKEGSNTQLAGLTIGAEYYLSATTPGAVTLTPPSTLTQVVQQVGTAINATTLDFEPARPIILA